MKWLPAGSTVVDGTILDLYRPDRMLASLVRHVVERETGEPLGRVIQLFGTHNVAIAESGARLGDFESLREAVAALVGFRVAVGHFFSRSSCGNL